MKSYRQACLVCLLILFGCGASGSDAPGDATDTGSAPVTTDTNRARSNVTDPDRDGPTKWALLIGIDKYLNINDLQGAANDVRMMRQLLTTKYGFPEANVDTLVNEQATHEGIVNAIRNHLIANVQPGDIVVLHYSGHGSKMRDASGDELDGLDETIVPHDSRMPGHFDVTDDQINGLLSQITAVTQNVTLIFDSCHSGTVTRGALTRNVPADDRQPPDPPQYARSVSGGQNVAFYQPGSNLALLSSAVSDQLAAEHVVGGRSYGAFTFFFVKALEAAAAPLTYRDVIDQVRGNIQRFAYNQKPQLEGAGAETFVFSDSSGVTDAYFETAPLGSNRVMISGGSVHGLTKGSLFDVYSPGVRRFAADVRPLARVELTSVGAVESVGRIEGNAEQVPRASRAVEVSRNFADVQLHVAYHGLETSAQLRQVKGRLDEWSHIKTVPEAEREYNILIVDDGAHLLIERADTTIVSTPVPKGAPNAVDRIVEQVDAWVKWFNVLSITNPAPKVSVDFMINAIEPDGDSRSPFMQPSLVEEVATLVEGEQFEVIVKNTSNRDLFITLIDVSSDGSISQIFPPPGAAEQLAKGQEWRDRWQTFIPPEFDGVRDIIKVFATSRPVELHPLTQSGVRSVPDELETDDPLTRLIQQAMIGGTRGATRVGVDDWVTAELAFRIVRE